MLHDREAKDEEIKTYADDISITPPDSSALWSWCHGNATMLVRMPAYQISDRKKGVLIGMIAFIYLITFSYCVPSTRLRLKSWVRRKQSDDAPRWTYRWLCDFFVSELKPNLGGYIRKKEAYHL